MINENKKKSTSNGQLYVVATPIGNLNDISLRALEVLQQVALIAAEDPRHSQKLLAHFNINTPLTALHEHNEIKRSHDILSQLLQGKEIALITDAGTPLISDPGFYLVREARAEGVTVTPIPGPTALITALSVSGLPVDRFVFEGFPPAKPIKRQHYLQTLREEMRTLIFYESPHRIMHLLTDLAAIFGADRYVVIARELTKLYETIHGDQVQQLRQWLAAQPQQQQGEFVVIVQGAKHIMDKTELDEQAIATLKILLAELPLKQAVKLAAAITGEKRNVLYDYALQDVNKSI